METPPPFNPQPNYSPPTKKKSPIGLILALIIGLVSVCCLLPLGLLAYGGLKFGAPIMGIATCGIGIEEGRLAILDYEKAKGKFPPAETWQTDIKPFYQKRLDSIKKKDNMGPFTPWSADEDWVCSEQAPKSGIAYNSDLAGKKRSEVSDDTVLIFEVETVAKNQHMPYVERPTKSGPVMFGSRRPWLDARVGGGHRRGQIQISTHESDGSDPSDSSDNSDTSDSSEGVAAPAKPAQPAAPPKKGASQGD